MEGDLVSPFMTERRGTRPSMGPLGLLATVITAGALTTMTARECHLSLAFHGVRTSFLPSLLFGAASWFWWVGVTVLIWKTATRWPPFLNVSSKGVLLHAGLASIVAELHIVFLTLTLHWDSTHWLAWGHAYAGFYVTSLNRFGLDLAIYGCVYGLSAVWYAQYHAQEATVQTLELERRLTQAQLKALQMQMEPHFLFNTLNAITSLMVQGRNKEAIKTMTHLNNILRTTLQRKAPEKVPFAEELRVVESYLAIQQVRFAGRLEVKIDATPEAMDGLVPCFLLQPIVENAIQHGIAPLEAGGLIETHVKRVGDMLWMEVKDNGCGPIGSDTKGHGIGMQNIRERLAYFYPDAYEFHAVAPVGGGYEVTIQIPYERAMA
jgi:hypothetical protein